MKRPNYIVFQTGMVFHSRGYDRIGNTIAWAENWGIVDHNIPNHSGFIYIVDGRVFVVEVQFNGFKLDSIEKYCTDKDVIISLYNPRLSTVLREQLASDITYHLSKDFDKKYDYPGAIGSAPWFRRWMPWIGFNPSGEFCSEKVYQTIESNTVVHFPDMWKQYPPNPWDLAQYMESQPNQFEKVNNFYL